VGAGLLVGLLAAVVHRQGLDLLFDGQRLDAAWLVRRGGLLYTDLVQREGPLDAHLLALLFSFLGERAATLALAKALLDGLTAAVGLMAARRLGAGAFSVLVPLGVLALGPVPPFLALCGLCALLLGGTGPRCAGAAGLTAGLAALCGLDGLALAGGLLLFAVGRRRAEELPRGALALGAALPLGITVAVGLLRGHLGAGVEQVGGLGLRHLIEQLARVPGRGLVESLVSGGGQAHPFSDLGTGEKLEGFLPLHGAWRAAAWRLRTVALFALPMAAWHVPPPSPLRRSILALAALPLVGVVLRGDAAFVDAAALGALVLGAALAARLPARSRLVAGLVAFLLLGPPLGESLWLAAHAQRPGLETWARSRAGVSLATARIGEFEALDAAMPVPASTPVLIWPASPGLHFLLDRPWADPQVILLRGWVRDGEAVAKRLADDPPAVALLGLAWHYTGRQVEHLAPGAWEVLRRRYEVLGNVVSDAVRLRMLQRLPPGTDARTLPLPRRLPEVEQPVANDASPPLRPRFEIGQTIQMGPTDLEGISVRWRTEARDLRVPLRLRVWGRRNGAFHALLAMIDVEIEIPGDLHRSWLRLAPVADTASREIAVTFELLEEPASELRLLWHRQDGDEDFYPEGAALVEMRPLPADLYFFAW
jgi:hypothetical protein